MTLQEKQAKLKEYDLARITSVAEAVVEVHIECPTTQLIRDRVVECIIAYLDVIKNEGVTPRLFADVYQPAALQLDIYADLVQAGVSRFRRKNTKYSSNAAMLDAYADKVARIL